MLLLGTSVATAQFITTTKTTGTTRYTVPVETDYTTSIYTSNSVYSATVAGRDYVNSSFNVTTSIVVHMSFSSSLPLVFMLMNKTEFDNYRSSQGRGGAQVLLTKADELTLSFSIDWTPPDTGVFYWVVLNENSGAANFTLNISYHMPFYTALIQVAPINTVTQTQVSYLTSVQQVPDVVLVYLALPYFVSIAGVAYVILEPKIQTGKGFSSQVFLIGMGCMVSGLPLLFMVGAVYAENPPGLDWMLAIGLTWLGVLFLFISGMVPPNCPSCKIRMPKTAHYHTQKVPPAHAITEYTCPNCRYVVTRSRYRPV
jgi:hypothetical protein